MPKYEEFAREQKKIGENSGESGTLISCKAGLKELKSQEKK